MVRERAEMDEDTASGGPERLQLTLASASPQRRAILEQLGITFAVVPANVEEEGNGDPVAVAQRNARRKAEAVAGDLVLGADTLVTIDGAILGKPRDEQQAGSYLNQLRGRMHQVVGAIALASEGRVFAEAVETTDVWLRNYEDRLLNWYLKTGEWNGRAGGYAIQGHGAALVARIEGDYLNVVGLSLVRLLELLPDMLFGVNFSLPAQESDSEAKPTSPQHPTT